MMIGGNIMAFKFKDNATHKIMALDYDGCMTKHNEFPKCGEPREYVGEVVKILRGLGTKIVIWTCRDRLPNPIDPLYNDKFNDQEPMIKWLKDNDIEVDGINCSFQYAPWDYEARKIYAHMYVDDMGFGWEDTDEILLDVMVQFMIKHLGIPFTMAYRIKGYVKDKANTRDILKWIEVNMGGDNETTE